MCNRIVLLHFIKVYTGYPGQAGKINQYFYLYIKYLDFDIFEQARIVHRMSELEHFKDPLEDLTSLLR